MRTLGCGEEGVGFGQVPIRENRQLMFKRSELPKAFRGRFKDSVRKKVMGFMITSRTVLWLIVR